MQPFQYKLALTALTVITKLHTLNIYHTKDFDFDFVYSNPTLLNYDTTLITTTFYLLGWKDTHFWPLAWSSLLTKKINFFSTFSHF